MSNEIGPSEDMFEVYRGGIVRSAGCARRLALHREGLPAAPAGAAVEEFRKAIAEAEKPTDRRKNSPDAPRSSFRPGHVTVARDCGISPFRVYSPRLVRLDPCPRSTIALSNAPSAGPDNVALELQRHDHLESCTYAELHRMAESVGRWITENKFARGSRLAILADNHPRWVAAYLGIIASGCAAVPLDTALHDDQVTKLLKDSGTVGGLLRCEACSGRAAGRHRTEDRHDPHGPRPHDRRIAADEHWLGDICLPSSKPAPATSNRLPQTIDDLASLLYTSGTTADPKGVMLTHANFLGEVEAVFNWVDLGPTDALLGVLPAVSRSGADGESAAATGQGIARRLSGNPQHHGTSARSDRAQHHGVRRRAAILST